MKKEIFTVGVVIPVALVALTLIALLLMNQVHA